MGITSPYPDSFWSNIRMDQIFAIHNQSPTSKTFSRFITSPTSVVKSTKCFVQYYCSKNFRRSDHNNRPEVPKSHDTDMDSQLYCRIDDVRHAKTGYWCKKSALGFKVTSKMNDGSSSNKQTTVKGIALKHESIAKHSLSPNRIPNAKNSYPAADISVNDPRVTPLGRSKNSNQNVSPISSFNHEPDYETLENDEEYLGAKRFWTSSPSYQSASSKKTLIHYKNENIPIPVFIEDGQTINSKNNFTIPVRIECPHKITKTKSDIPIPVIIEANPTSAHTADDYTNLSDNVSSSFNNIKPNSNLHIEDISNISTSTAFVYNKNNYQNYDQSCRQIIKYPHLDKCILNSSNRRSFIQVKPIAKGRSALSGIFEDCPFRKSFCTSSSWSVDPRLTSSVLSTTTASTCLVPWNIAEKQVISSDFTKNINILPFSKEHITSYYQTGAHSNNKITFPKDLKHLPGFDQGSFQSKLTNEPSLNSTIVKLNPSIIKPDFTSEIKTLDASVTDKPIDNLDILAWLDGASLSKHPNPENKDEKVKFNCATQTPSEWNFSDFFIAAQTSQAKTLPQHKCQIFLTTRQNNRPAQIVFPSLQNASSRKITCTLSYSDEKSSSANLRLNHKTAKSSGNYVNHNYNYKKTDMSLPKSANSSSKIFVVIK